MLTATLPDRPATALERTCPIHRGTCYKPHHWEWSERLHELASSLDIDEFRRVLARDRKERVARHNAGFKPLAGPRRFRILETRWLPPVPSVCPDGDQLAAFELECDEFPRIPVTLFQWPFGNFALTGTLAVGESELLTREDAIKRVITTNLEVVRASLDLPRGCVGARWLVFVEIGQPIQAIEIAYSLNDEALGFETHRVKQPIRRPTPTEDELIRYLTCMFVDLPREADDGTEPDWHPAQPRESL